MNKIELARDTEVLYYKLKLNYFETPRVDVHSYSLKKKQDLQTLVTETKKMQDEVI